MPAIARRRAGTSKKPPQAQIPWPAIMREARSRFNIRGFRAGQREIIEAVFRGRDVLGILPTGAGKSLTYFPKAGDRRVRTDFLRPSD